MTNALIYSIAMQSHIPKRIQMNIFETVWENVEVKKEWRMEWERNIGKLELSNDVEQTVPSCKMLCSLENMVFDLLAYFVRNAV